MRSCPIGSPRRGWFLTNVAVPRTIRPLFLGTPGHDTIDDSTDQLVLFVRGQNADAEPAVPNWRMPVNRIFG